LRRRLTAWFAKNARDLPWRRTRDPYQVWVSEIMLQQTQVATVSDYFNRFVAAFPTIQSLASADERDVMRHWEGLGYYRRARGLHEAAGVVMREHAGEFPREIEAVRRLPGIGRYTAGAILSIAFDQPQPILEANTIRLYSRLLAYRGSTHSAAGQQLLWRMGEILLPRRGAGQINQALMELGATVCLPRDPRCVACPLKTLCPAFARGWQQAIPAIRPKPAVEEVREAAIAVRRGRMVLLLKHGPGERWAGLWDFPRFGISATHQDQLAQELSTGVQRLTGLAVTPVAKLATIKHGVTRFRITLEFHEARCRSRRTNGGSNEMRWVQSSQLAEYPLSVPARRLSLLL
jgi:A/G-specific adenine glycosylase